MLRIVVLTVGRAAAAADTLQDRRHTCTGYHVSVLLTYLACCPLGRCAALPCARAE